MSTAMTPSDAANVAVFLKRQIESGIGSPESSESLQRVVDHLTAQIARMTQPLFNPVAFPSHGSMGEVTHEGMSLRDYFAAKAMQSIVAGAMAQGGATEEEDAPKLARVAWLMADAMLATRKTPNVRANRPDTAEKE